GGRPSSVRAVVGRQHAGAQTPWVAAAPAAQPDDSAPVLTEVTAPVSPILPMDLATDHLNVGAYDPELALADQPLNMEQWYVPQNDPQVLAGALAHAENQRTPLVTIEPWPTGGSTDVLGDVVSGKSDDDLRQLARIAAASQPQVVLVRWGHEMELANLYPWSAQDPATYQQAFRHV